MQFQTFTILDQEGRPSVAAPVYVYRSGSNRLVQAHIYDADGELITQPGRTDAQGHFGFQTIDGFVDIVASVSGLEDVTQNVQFSDVRAIRGRVLEAPTLPVFL